MQPSTGTSTRRIDAVNGRVSRESSVLMTTTFVTVDRSRRGRFRHDAGRGGCQQSGRFWSSARGAPAASSRRCSRAAASKWEWSRSTTTCVARGSGITLQGNALRVLREIGAWETAKLDGYGFNSTGIRLPDGTIVAELDDIKTGGPDLPATMGMERRKLAKVLVDTATGAGASLRLATTVSRSTAAAPASRSPSPTAARTGTTS